MLIQSASRPSQNVKVRRASVGPVILLNIQLLCRGESPPHSAAMTRWYDALIIATSSMSDISRVSLSAASHSGFSALRTLSLTVIGWASSSVTRR
jgi:hypothetical protein